MTHPNRWKTRPEGDMILCDVTGCAHGMGQAGAGRCPGDPSLPGRTCPEYTTDADYEKLMERETK